MKRSSAIGPRIQGGENFLGNRTANRMGEGGQRVMFLLHVFMGMERTRDLENQCVS